MNIILLCRNLRVAGGQVIGLNFCNSLKDLGIKHRILIIAPPNAGYQDIELPPNSRLHIYRGGNKSIAQWWFDTFVAPQIAKEFKADIVFAMGNIGLINPPCDQAILFHKSQLIYPPVHYANETLYEKIKNNLYKIRLKKCLKKTKLVFCQTPIARDRFHEEFKFPKNKIEIMHNAVSKLSIPLKNKNKKPKIFNGKKYYNLFFLTKYYAHKNLEILISLFRKHIECLHDVRCIVTIEANQHVNAPRFLKDIDKYELKEHIVNVGQLSQDELAGYFYHSDALFFPTILESFSGTYLEAMHFGLPILTSDLDFGRYICNDAAIYFDPWDLDSILSAINRLRNDSRLQKELSRRGKERLCCFYSDWNHITGNVIKELEKLKKRII